MMARSLIATAALLLTACPARPTPAAPSDLLAERDGPSLYGHYCALCHGERGEGYAADNANALIHEGFMETYDDAFLRAAIADGRPGTAMAAYSRAHDGPLSRRDIDTLVAWLRAESATEPMGLDEGVWARDGDASAGAPIYAARCAGCHGDEGQGVTALSLNHPYFLSTANDPQLAHAIARGRAGTPMPAFEDDLTRPQMRDIVALIRSWQRPRTDVAPPRQTQFEDLPVVIHPDGPTPEFTLREARFVSSAQVSRALRGGARMIIVDARARSDWHRLHIPGAIPAPYYNVQALIPRLPRDGTWVIAYCGCPHAASGQVRDALARAGFENVAVLDEGIFRWTEMGYDVVANE